MATSSPFDEQRRALERGFAELPPLPAISPRAAASERIQRALRSTVEQQQRRAGLLAWVRPWGAVAAAILLAVTLNVEDASFDTQIADAYVQDWLAAAETSDEYLATVLNDPWKAPSDLWEDPSEELDDLIDGLDDTLGSEI
jgi:hypothetical protein